MSHWIMTPVLLPMLTAVLLIFLAEGGRAGGGRAVQRVVSIAATTVLLLAAFAMVIHAADGGYDVYRLGNWPAPFGIVFVLDRLSALMVLLTSIVALASVLYASRGGDAEAHYFHTLFQLQIAGIMGAFLTGDIFNLFVFFEILLIASYCLLLYGGTLHRVKSGVHYVVINLLGSALFLVGVGVLYGVTGTLNMADLAVKVAALGPADAGLVRAGALILLVVFGIKAALVPLYFWLPNTYASANAAVAALFAIMTKVGVYSILRIYTLVFGEGAGVAALVAAPWLLGAALTTLILGALGALAATSLRRMQGYLLIMSVGTMLAAIGLFSREGVAAGVYYMFHSTVAVAAMFLIADLVSQQRGLGDDRLERGARLLQNGVLGVLFFLGAIAVAGLPPFSGFLGKALILAAAPQSASGWWLWGVLLTGSLLALVALGRGGSILFWNSFGTSGDDPFGRTMPDLLPVRHSFGSLLPVCILLASVVLLTVFAGAATEYADGAAAQLMDPGAYVDAVLRQPTSSGGGQ